jgi:hypothetical protein
VFFRCITSNTNQVRRALPTAPEGAYFYEAKSLDGNHGEFIFVIDEQEIG